MPQPAEAALTYRQNLREVGFGCRVRVYGVGALEQVGAVELVTDWFLRIIERKLETTIFVERVCIGVIVVSVRV